MIFLKGKIVNDIKEVSNRRKLGLSTGPLFMIQYAFMTNIFTGFILNGNKNKHI